MLTAVDAAIVRVESVVTKSLASACVLVRRGARALFTNRFALIIAFPLPMLTVHFFRQEVLPQGGQ